MAGGMSWMPAEMTRCQWATCLLPPGSPVLTQHRRLAEEPQRSPMPPGAPPTSAARGAWPSLRPHRPAIHNQARLLTSPPGRAQRRPVTGEGGWEAYRCPGSGLSPGWRKPGCRAQPSWGSQAQTSSVTPGGPPTSFHRAFLGRLKGSLPLGCGVRVLSGPQPLPSAMWSMQ